MSQVQSSRGSSPSDSLTHQTTVWENSVSEDFGDQFSKAFLKEDTVEEQDMVVSYWLRQVFRHDYCGFSPWTESQVKDGLVVTKPNNGFQHIRGKLIAAMKAKKWHLACELALQPQPTPSFDEELFTSSLVKDWKLKYQGVVCDAFLQEVKEHMQKRGTYAQTVNILQSSGMGKSRLVSEVSESIFSFTFTLRTPGEKGFPLGDHDIFSFLTSGSLKEDSTHPTAIALIGGTLAVMHDDLSKATGEVNFDFAQFLKKWNEESQAGLHATVNAARQNLLARILEKAKHIKEGLKSTSFAKNKWRIHKGFDYVRDKYISRILKEPLTKIEELLKAKDKREGIPRICMIHFDEAANLVSGDNDNRYTALRRVISSLVKTCLWVTFLSTNSRIEKFVPSKKDDSSDRVVRGFKHRLPPFTAFQLNLEAEKLEKENGSKELREPISTFGTVKHMSKYGRPLWKPYAEDWRASEVLTFVHKKLIPELAYDPNNEHHAFAAIAFRVCLDPVMNEKSSEFAKRAVDYHLRALVEIDLTNSIVETITPPEPLVAQAAASILNETMALPVAGTSLIWAASLKTVTGNLLRGGKVDKGNRGELLSRILIMLAHDHVLRTRQASIPEVPRYSQPIKVTDFLTTLLAYQVTKLEKIFEPTENGLEPKYNILNGVVNFNHFASTNEFLQAAGFQDLLLRLLHQHAALQLAFQQEDWDILIPVYCGSTTEELEKEKLSAIFVQVKNRVKPTRVSLGTEYDRFFGNRESVIMIQMELGVDVETPEKAFQTTSRTPTDSSNDPFVAAIIARGLSKVVYPVLEDQELHQECIDLRRCLTPEVVHSGISHQLKARLRSFPYNKSGGDDDVEMADA